MNPHFDHATLRRESATDMTQVGWNRAAPGTDGPDVGLRILGPVRQGTLRDNMG